MARARPAEEDQSNPESTRAEGRGMAPAREDEVIVGALAPLGVAPFIRTCQNRFPALSPGSDHVYVSTGLMAYPAGSPGDYLPGFFTGFGRE